MFCVKYTSEKTEGAIKNGQFSDTVNIGCSRHRTKTNKTKNTTQKTKKMSNMDPIKNLCAPEW